MRGALPAAAALVPLAITPGLLFYFDVTPKIIVLLVACAAVWFLRQDLCSLLSRRRGLVFLLLLAFQLASLILSTLFSTHPALSAVGSSWRRLGLVVQIAIGLLALAAAAHVANDSKKLIPLLRAVCLAGIAAALYGCAQYFGFDPWLPAAEYHIGEGEWSIVRPPSTLGHASYAASFYLQAIFWGIALVRVDSSRLWIALGWTVVLLGSVATVLSGTRGAMVGWLAGIFVLALLLRPAINVKRLAWAAAIVLACAAFYVAPAGQKLRSRTRWSTEDPRGGARFELWRDAARMGSDHWLVGWGPEAFLTEFPHYQSRDLARAFPDFYYESPHNLFLEAWTAQGILGLAGVISLCLLGLWSIPGARGGISTAESALGAGFVALTVSLQFIPLTAPTALAFYLTLGLSTALGPSNRAGANARQGRIAFAVPRLIAIPVGVITLLCAAQLAITDQLLESARELLRAGRIVEAERIYKNARRWQVADSASDLWFSRALTDAAARSSNPLMRISSFETARQAAERASQQAGDRQNAYYTLAQIHSLNENLPEVIDSLRRSIAAAPMWFKPHWALAEALDLAGRRDEALAEAKLADDLDAGKDPEVRQTLTRLQHLAP